MAGLAIDKPKDLSLSENLFKWQQPQSFTGGLTLPAADNHSSASPMWDWFGQGEGVLGSGIAYDDFTSGVGIAGNLFDSWTGYKNMQDQLKLDQQIGAANIDNLNARTTTLNNRQATLAYNNAQNNPITGNSLSFGQQQQQQPVPQAPTQRAPTAFNWNKGV